MACGDADPVHYAYLHDRVRMADGREQLYGSQFVRDEQGRLVPWHMDDLGKVDARRARLGLPPFAEHARMHERWRERLLQTTDQTTDDGSAAPAVPRRPTGRDGRCVARALSSRAGRGMASPWMRAVPGAHAEVVDRPHVEAP